MWEPMRERLALQVNDSSCIVHRRIQTGVPEPLADVIVGIRSYSQCQTWLQLAGWSFGA
jgi:hypothetical protein